MSTGSKEPAGDLGDLIHPDGAAESAVSKKHRQNQENVDTNPFHLDADWASTGEWEAANPAGFFRAYSKPAAVWPREVVQDDPELAESMTKVRQTNAVRKQLRESETKFKHWWRRGMRRVDSSWMYILQAGVAAAAAYWVAEFIFGHYQPFFAPIAAMVMLGVQGGARLRRGWELVIGVALGVGLGQLLVYFIGSGMWQLFVVVVISITVAIFVGRGAIMPLQAAGSAVLVTVLAQPEMGVDRMVDALIGGLVGLLVISLMPNSPVGAARRKVAKILHKSSRTLVLTSKGLALDDKTYVREGLENARGTQGTINSMQNLTEGGTEVTTLSPLYWRFRQRTAAMSRIMRPVDNIVRNVRVLARRALILLDDHIQSPPELTKLVFDLSEVLEYMGDVFDTSDRRFAEVEAESMPEIVHALRLLGGRAQLRLVKGTGLSGAVILAECRSIIVDALQVCGLSEASAQAVLYPTVTHPGQAPELWTDIEDTDLEDSK